MTVVIRPGQNIAVCTLQEANPSGQSNNPEILILGNCLKGVNKANLNGMGLSLHDFFLCVGINHNGQHHAENGKHRVRNPIHTNIIQVVVGGKLRNQRQHDIDDRRC